MPSEGLCDTEDKGCAAFIHDDMAIVVSIYVRTKIICIAQYNQASC